MAGNLVNATVFLIDTLFGLYIFAVVLRFMMQTSRVDFYNPLSQGIFKLTDPPVRPLRRLIPAIYGVDIAVLVLAFLLQLIALLLVVFLRGYPFPSIVSLIAWPLLGILALIFRIYFVGLIVMVVASWIAPYSNHPVITVVYQLTEPICRPARRLLPPMGGLDFSIILVFLFISLIDTYLLVTPMMNYYCPVPAGIFSQGCPRFVMGL